MKVYYLDVLVLVVALLGTSIVTILEFNHSFSNVAGKDTLVTCWVPAHFTGSHLEYANRHCSQAWLAGKVYNPPVGKFPYEIYKQETEEVNQYKLKLLLLAQPIVALSVFTLLQMIRTVLFHKSHASRQKKTLSSLSILETNSKEPWSKKHHPESSPVAGESSTVAGGSSPMAGELSPMAGRPRPVAGELSPMAGESSPVAGELSPVAGESSSVAGGSSIVTMLYCSVLLVALVIWLILAGLSSGIFLGRKEPNGNIWQNSAPQPFLCDMKIREMGIAQAYTLQCLANPNWRFSAQVNTAVCLTNAILVLINLLNNLLCVPLVNKKLGLGLAGEKKRGRRYLSDLDLAVSVGAL